MAIRSIICSSLRLRHIIDLIATDKSRYFAQPRSMIVNYCYCRCSWWWWYLLLGLLVLRPSISSLLQSATSLITIWDRYTKCDNYYKVRHPRCFENFFTLAFCSQTAKLRVRFFWENPNPNPKTDSAFWGANPKTHHESIKYTLRVDSLDQIQIRIFEIHNLSFLCLGKDLNKVLLTSGFSKKNGTWQMSYRYDILFEPMLVAPY